MTTGTTGTLDGNARGLHADLIETGGLTAVEMQDYYGEGYVPWLEALVTGGYAANGDGVYRVTGKPITSTTASTATVPPEKGTPLQEIGKGRSSYANAGGHMRESTRIANEAKMTGCAMRVWSSLATLIGSYSKTQDRIALSQIAELAFPSLDESMGKKQVSRYMPEVLASGAVILVEPAVGRRAALYRLPSPS